MKLQIEPIAWVRSCYKDKLLTPRQAGLVPSSRGQVVLAPGVSLQALEGLEGFSHIWLIFGFHVHGASTKSQVRSPRLRKKVGVFASRSPHRPNALGLSVLEIEKVENRSIWVRGLDLVDETPIYDIKPYLKTDRIQDCQEGWSSELGKKELKVTWSAKAQDKIADWKLDEGYIKMLEESLVLDPRPLSYKRELPRGEKYTPQFKTFRSHLDKIDVEFRSHEYGITVEDFHLR